MTRIIFSVVLFFIITAGNLAAEDRPSHDIKPHDIKLTYKAYWGGFAISKVYSTIHIGLSDYQMDVSYTVSGIAAIFSKMKNKVSARGKITPDGRLKPLYYEDVGSWGRHGYSIHTAFQEQDSKVISHDYSFNFKEEFNYISIKEDLKSGPDMVSFYLGLTLDSEALKIGPEIKHQNVFGGFFLLDIGYQCTGTRQLKTQRSLYKGEVLVCEFSDEIIGGNFEKVKKKKRKQKKKKKRSSIEPVPLQIWYAKLDVLKESDVMVPVYSEFAVDWGKVRVYLSEIEVITK